MAVARAEDGTVLRGLDAHRIRDGQIAAMDVFGRITAGTESG
ncbi:hypothetical protein AB0883_21300 [Micromonospora sp. NPDC047812]